VGIDTPEAIIKSTPTHFQNEAGEYIYGFCGGNDGQELCDRVQQAVDAARAAAIAEMRGRVDQAEAARKEAEKKRKEAEKSLAEAKKQAGANAAILSRAEKAEAELAEARRQLEAATKAEQASIVNQNGDLALFNVIFNQTQEGVNKMQGLRLKLGKADEALDEKLKTAINALADAVRRCAE